MREANGECALFVVVIVADAGVILFAGVIGFGIGVVGCVLRCGRERRDDCKGCCKGMCECKRKVGECENVKDS
jgi:hypothetical protein